MNSCKTSHASQSKSVFIIADCPSKSLQSRYILIPSPYVTDDHQRKNAQYLEDNNACILINESEFINTDLIKILEKLKFQEYRTSIGDNAWKLFKYNASHDIAKKIIKEINN